MQEMPCLEVVPRFQIVHGKNALERLNGTLPVTAIEVLLHPPETRPWFGRLPRLSLPVIQREVAKKGVPDFKLFFLRLAS